MLSDIFIQIQLFIKIQPLFLSQYAYILCTLSIILLLLYAYVRYLYICLKVLFKEQFFLRKCLRITVTFFDSFLQFQSSYSEIKNIFSIFRIHIFRLSCIFYPNVKNSHSTYRILLRKKKCFIDQRFINSLRELKEAASFNINRSTSR
jgi:hypothetical protein